MSDGEESPRGSIDGGEDKFAGSKVEPDDNDIREENPANQSLNQATTPSSEDELGKVNRSDSTNNKQPAAQKDDSHLLRYSADSS